MFSNASFVKYPWCDVIITFGKDINNDNISSLIILELLSSKNNGELIAELRNYYDIIILDCPPVLGMSDTLVLTKHSDANLIVVSNGKTHMETLEKAKKQFEQANAKISGVIVNKANVKGSSYHSYYTNDYYTETTE